MLIFPESESYSDSSTEMEEIDDTEMESIPKISPEADANNNLVAAAVPDANAMLLNAGASVKADAEARQLKDWSEEDDER